MTSTPKQSSKDNFFKNKITYFESPMNYDKFIKAFCRLNHFKVLGKGLYAKVLGNQEHDHVYKVARVHDVRYDAYLNYLKSIHNKINPLFPVIYNITVFTHKNESFYVVEMEKLETFEASKSTQLFDELRTQLDNHLYGFKPFDYKYAYKPVTFIKKIGMIKLIPYINETLTTLNRLTKRFEADWHEDNVMMRKDGQLVITDPVH